MLLLLSALVFAIGLKAALLFADVIPFNADEAVVALMAKHILQGARPAFFYGQAYMGSLDALLAAMGFAIFGEEVWVIRLVQTILYTGTILTTVWVGKAAFGSIKVGALAAWLLAIPTVNVTLYTTVSLGGYGEMLLLGNIILLVGFRIGKLITADGVLARWYWWAAWGFLAGLGLWVFGLTLVYSLPAAVYLGWKLLERSESARDEGVSRIRKAVLFVRFSAAPATLAVMGGLAGSAPWWVYAYQFGWSGLVRELAGSAIAGVEGLPWIFQVFQHVYNGLLLGTSVILGLRPPWDVRWLALPMIPFVLMIWMVVIVHALKRIRRGEEHRENALVLAGVCLTLLAGFVLTPFGADPSGRYFLPLAVPMAIFAGDAFHEFQRRWGKLALGLLGVLLVYHLAGTVQAASKYPPGITTQFYHVAQVDHSYMPELIEFLRENEELTGYTNYWVAYPLAFLSNEELIFTPRLPYHLDLRYTRRDDRYAPYTERAASADRVAYITTKNPGLNFHLRSSFSAKGISWEETEIGDYLIFYKLSEAVRPTEIDLGRTTRR